MKDKFSLSRWGAVAAIVAAVSLSACFGDGGGDNPQAAATSEVPDTASQSTSGLIAYLEALIASDADGLEPVDSSVLNAPAEETTEPVTII